MENLYVRFCPSFLITKQEYRAFDQNWFSTFFLVLLFLMQLGFLEVVTIINPDRHLVARN